MSAGISQIQIKVSLSGQLNELLRSKASRFGVPVTQFVKHLIMKEVEDEISTFAASDWLEDKTKKAMSEMDKAIEVKDIRQFFKNL